MQSKLKLGLIVLGVIVLGGVGVMIFSFNDTSNTIKNAIAKAHSLNNSKTNISATAFEIALKQLV